VRIFQLLSNTYSFLKLHRIVVLIVSVIIVGSVFSIFMAARRANIEPTFVLSGRSARKVTMDEGLPPRQLKPWGINPFRDILKEREIERKKREEAFAALDELDAMAKGKGNG